MKPIILLLLLVGCCKETFKDCMDSCVAWRLSGFYKHDRARVFKEVITYCQDMQCKQYKKENY